MAEQWKVPFDRQGNQLEFGGYKGGEWWVGADHVEMRDNEEFQDTLVYEGYRRGRSAAFFLWRRFQAQTTVTMFMSELDRLLREGKLQPGVGNLGCTVTGRWHFTKRGANYSVSLLEKEKP